MFEELQKSYPEATSELIEQYSRNDKVRILPIDLDTINSACENDPDLTELYDEMIKSFYGYTEILCKYQQFQLKQSISQDDTADYQEEAKKLDEERRIAHDATISCVNSLARVMQTKNTNGDWIKKLDNRRVLYAKVAVVTTFNSLIKEIEQKNIGEAN